MEVARSGIQSFFVRCLAPDVDPVAQRVHADSDGWDIGHFYELAQTVSAGMATSQYTGLGPLYDKTISQVDKIIQGKNPILLTCLLQVCCRFAQQNQVPLLHVLLRHIGSRAAMHPESRSLKRLCDALLRTPTELLPDLLVASTSLAVEIVSSQRAPGDPQTLSAERGLFSALLTTGNFTRAMDHFVLVADKEKKEEREDDLATSMWRLEALIRLVCCELAMKRLDDADRRINDMAATVKTIETALGVLPWKLEFWLLEFRGELLRLRGDPGAREVLEQAVEVATRGCEWRNWWIVIHAKNSLELAMRPIEPGAEVPPFVPPS